jgi:hypothetical protein
MGGGRGAHPPRPRPNQRDVRQAFDAKHRRTLQLQGFACDSRRPELLASPPLSPLFPLTLFTHSVPPALPPSLPSPPSGPTWRQGRLSRNRSARAVAIPPKPARVGLGATGGHFRAAPAAQPRANPFPTHAAQPRRNLNTVPARCAGPARLTFRPRYPACGRACRPWQPAAVRPSPAGGAAGGAGWTETGHPVTG